MGVLCIHRRAFTEPKTLAPFRWNRFTAQIYRTTILCIAHTYYVSFLFSPRTSVSPHPCRERVLQFTDVHYRLALDHPVGRHNASRYVRASLLHPHFTTQ